MTNQKPPNIFQWILPPTALISASDKATNKSLIDPDKSKNSGIAAAWKGGALTSSLTK